MAARLRKGATPFEYAWIVEVSPSPSFVSHAHVLVLGSTSSFVFRKALAAFGGRGDVQPIRSARIVSRYILKMALVGLDLPIDEAARL